MVKAHNGLVEVKCQHPCFKKNDTKEMLESCNRVEKELNLNYQLHSTYQIIQHFTVPKFAISQSEAVSSYCTDIL